MTDNQSFSRRRLLTAGLSAAALGAAGPALAALRPTPQQTRGPFYPLRFPLDSDNDLVRIQGRAARALGEVTHLYGRVLGPDGKPVPGARVEIWQCDSNGVYHHPGDGRPTDGNFQAYGRTLAARDGGYRFRTIKPVPYPGRAPHIHFVVRAPNFRELVTQMYIRGHKLNARDWVFRRAAASGGTIDAAFETDLKSGGRLLPPTEDGAQYARFDIVLGG